MGSNHHRLLLAFVSSAAIGGGACRASPSEAPATPSPAAAASSTTPPEGAPAGEEGPSSESPEPIELTLFFPDRERILDASCDAVAPVRRTVEATNDVPSLLVRQLLRGPTEPERAAHPVMNPFDRGRFTHLPELEDLSAYFDGVTLEGEVAFVDFGEKQALEYLLSDTSCRRMAVLSSIERTLQALPGIKVVRYRVEGREVSMEGGA